MKSLRKRCAQGSKTKTISVSRGSSPKVNSLMDNLNVLADVFYPIVRCSGDASPVTLSVITVCRVCASTAANPAT